MAAGCQFPETAFAIAYCYRESRKHRRHEAAWCQVYRKTLDISFEIHCERPFDVQIEILLRDDKYVVVVVFEGVLQVIVKALQVVTVLLDREGAKAWMLELASIDAQRVGA